MPTNMLSLHSHKDNNEVAIHEDNVVYVVIRIIIVPTNILSIN